MARPSLEKLHSNLNRIAHDRNIFQNVKPARFKSIQVEEVEYKNRPQAAAGVHACIACSIFCVFDDVFYPVMYCVLQHVLHHVLHLFMCWIVFQIVY